MHVVSATATDQFSLMSAFDEIRSQLVANPGLTCAQKPISHWARQGDRRLPYALLQHTVMELVNTPYAELASTPGIGPKKLASLLSLLQRALNDRAPVSALSAHSLDQAATPQSPFDANAVSESSWEAWRATVRKRGLENQTIGQLAPSLVDLPTVIWATELGAYLDLSLADLRALKTHGEKRVQKVLEVFSIVHAVFDGAGSHPKFAMALRPSFVLPIESWIQQQLDCASIPVAQDLRDHLTLPLLNQIQIDGGDTVHQLACGRLGIESGPESVRSQAAQLNVTRARVYQLLETCAEILQLRWPEGRRQLADLSDKLAVLAADDPCRLLLQATRSLVFPERFVQQAASVTTSCDNVEEPATVRS